MGAGILAALGGVGVGAYLWIDSLGGDEEPPAPAPSIVIREQQPAAAEDLGFPAFATKNTTRVAGSDPAANAAGVALAVFPSAGGVKRPAAVSLVADDDWPAGLAAASLVAQPIRAPILVTGSDEIPDFTADALGALAPAGSAKTDGKQVFTIGSATAPRGLRGAGGQRVQSRRDRRRDRPAAPEADRHRPAAHPAGELRAAGVRDARRRLGGALGRPGALPQEARRRPSPRSTRSAATGASPCTCSARLR